MRTRTAGLAALRWRARRRPRRTAQDRFRRDLQRAGRSDRQRHARRLRARARSPRPQGWRASRPGRLRGRSAEARGRQAEDRQADRGRSRQFSHRLYLVERPARVAQAGGRCADLPDQRQCWSSQIAGELCSPWFFSVSWQGDQVPQAIGEYLNQKGVKSAFLIAPNYAAGKDVLAGLKANFKGSVAGEEYTKWPDQLDFSVELAKARAPSRTPSSRSIPAPPASSFSRNMPRPGSRRRSRSTPPSSSTPCRCRGSTTSPWTFPAPSTG